MENWHQKLKIGVWGGGVTRRSAIRSLVGFASAASLAGVAGTLTTRAVAQTLAPDNVIKQFYLALATYQYKMAYSLLSSEYQARQSYSSFVKGFADTAYVQIMIVGDETSGSHQKVWVAVTAWHNDRSIHAFTGSYTLMPGGGGWKIADASIKENSAPRDVMPLMRFADVNVALGREEAATGHRFFNLLVTNHTQSTVLAAGVPHLKLLDHSGSIVVASTSGQEQPITAVPLRPGTQAQAMFEWSNWCKATPAYPLKLQIAIPGDSHENTIPFTTPDGSPQAPPCFGNAEPATFQSLAFQPVGHA